MIRVVLALVPLLCLIALPARADTEAWFWAEQRVPLTAPGGWAPTSLRLVQDLRIGTRYPGIGAVFFRGGPLWNIHPNFFLAIHGTGVATQSKPGVFTPEYRVEVEPNVTGRLWDFTFNDRNRVEYRWIGSDQRWRYRNQLRVNYAPEKAVIAPFIWDEVLFDLSGLGFNQNRAEIGLGFNFGPGRRFDLGYMLRSRLANGKWENDHVVNLSMYFAPPLETKN